MNPVFFLALFALYPLARAAKEDWDTGLVANLFSILVLVGALACWALFPAYMFSSLNVAGIAVWLIVLGLAWYNQKKSGIKLLGLADIYIGLTLTLLLGIWVNFVMLGMSVALVVFLLIKIFKKPEEMKKIFTQKTRLIPFYLLGLIGLIILAYLS